MYVVGLTGNVACGKSTVGEILAGLGARYVDADVLAHEAVRYGRAAYQSVVDAFGPGIVAADGEIDRRALAGIVFADAQRLALLESIVHPAVISLLEAELKAATEGVVVLDAIKLFESGLSGLCDEVWVVTCQRRRQVERLMRTRRMSRPDAVLRIDAQPPQSEKVARADVVIANDGGVEELRQRVIREWDRLRQQIETPEGAGST